MIKAQTAREESTQNLEKGLQADLLHHSDMINMAIIAATVEGKFRASHQVNQNNPKLVEALHKRLRDAGYEVMITHSHQFKTTSFHISW